VYRAGLIGSKPQPSGEAPVARFAKERRVDFDKAIDLEAIRRSGGVVEENAVASILAIGDGVYCVEFRSKMNAMDRDVLAMLERGVRLAETHGVGLVVANEGRVFSAGANLALIASDIEARAFDRIEQLLLAFQPSCARARRARRHEHGARGALGRTPAGGRRHKGDGAEGDSARGRISCRRHTVPGAGVRPHRHRSSEQVGGRIA